jgi:hypothetical protein
MNERIKELSDKCGLAWTLKTEQDVKNLVEFAELIVRECIGQVEKDIEPELDDSDYAEHWNMALRSASNEIKNHFGVEE